MLKVAVFYWGGLVGEWKVRWTKGFRLQVLEVLGRDGWDNVKRFLRDLEKTLNSDPSFIGKLERDPVVGELVYRRDDEIVWYNVRRLRYRGVRYRMFYVIRYDLKRIWFVGFEPRTNSSYKRKRYG